MEIILGIDPGTRKTGFGIMEWDLDRKIRVLEAGVIRLGDSESLERRLFRLHTELERIFSAFQPSVTVIEKIFLGRNADSAFKLGHARGVCLMAAAKHSSRVEEYAARAVKKSVTGNGGADKEQVRLIVTRELKYRPQTSEMDMSDALALAFCYVQAAKIEAKLKKGFGRGPEALP